MEESVLERNTEIYESFKEGATLQQMGSKFNLTRERIRQIILSIIRKDVLHKLLKKELLNNSGLSHYSYLESQEGKKLIRNQLDEIFNARKKSYELQNKQEMAEKIKQSENLGIIFEKFSSITKYSEAIGVSPQRLTEFFPEIAKKMKINLTRGQGGLKWSRFYLRCRVCRTDTVHHRANGYCLDCYEKTEEFKEIQKSSRLRHLEARIRHDKEYAKTYYKRPEVKIKFKQIQREIINKKLFGGNREKSMVFYGSKCFKCGLSREDNIRISKKDLCVVHKNGLKNDNSIENLIPLCRRCFRTFFWNKTFIG